jgi:hypothetical protein
VHSGAYEHPLTLSLGLLVILGGYREIVALVPGDRAAECVAPYVLLLYWVFLHGVHVLHQVRVGVRLAICEEDCILIMCEIIGEGHRVEVSAPAHRVLK